MHDRRHPFSDYNAACLDSGTIQCTADKGKRLEYTINPLPSLSWLRKPSAQYLFIPSIQLPLSSCEVLIQLAQGRHVLTGVSLRQQLLLYDLQL